MKIENVIAQRESIVSVIRSRLDIVEEFDRWCVAHLGFSEHSTIEDRLDMQDRIARGIANATMVYWEADLWQAAENGCVESFDVSHGLEPTLWGTLSENAPQWWTIGGKTGVQVKITYPDLETGHIAGQTANLGMLLQTKWVGAFQELWAIVITRPVALDDNSLTIRLVPLIAKGLTPSVAGPWIAHLAFLRLPFVHVERRRPVRAERRRADREGRELPDINIVTLRKAAPGESNGKREVDWQHSWIVSGHWRKQWYPSENSHKPVYVSPYLKGDPSKPLLSRPVAYKVVR